MTPESLLVGFMMLYQCKAVFYVSFCHNRDLGCMVREHNYIEENYSHPAIDSRSNVYGLPGKPVFRSLPCTFDRKKLRGPNFYRLEDLKMKESNETIN